jgi:ribosomal protein S12 methylthiotransferase accessory factor
VTSHTLTRRPQCPACGFPEEALDRPARPVPTGARGDARAGGRELRTVAPETTAERFAHHVSPVSGAVRRLVRVAGARPPLHVYLAGGPGPRRHGTDDGWAPGATTVPGGKGTTDAQARASALCEALERFSGEFAGDEPRRPGTLAALAPAAVHPNHCMGFSARQYEQREQTNAQARSFRTFVPAPFDPEAVVDWTPVWSLTHERERLLPTAYCYYSAHLPGHEACVADSNGNAAGNTVEEAILHGLLELVERDHVALWWYTRVPLPGVDLQGLGDPWLDGARAHFAAEGRRLWALDLTADLGIPVVAAVATQGTRPGGVALGFGAHLDLRLAAVRAVTELVQLGAGAPSGGAGHGPPEALDAAGSAYLHPAAGTAARTGDEGDALMTGDLGADLDACRRRIEAAGLEVMVLDQTRPDIGLPVVKAIVPGMRHFWPRLAPGRLYDVPVALGRLAEPLAEERLNPLPPAP